MVRSSRAATCSSPTNALASGNIIITQRLHTIFTFFIFLCVFSFCVRTPGNFMMMTKSKFTLSSNSKEKEKECFLSVYPLATVAPKQRLIKR